MNGQVPPRQPGDPRRLGPYELLGRLGQGGMGVVFLGRDRRGRLAAVKALRPELAGDPAFAARFRREVDAARRVDSPRVARVLDADPAGPRPWLATEYVDGATLAGAVADGGPLTGGWLLAFAAGVAQGLADVHAAGVVHRDLKPTNVLLLDPQARPGVKLIDFGIARAPDATMTRSGLRFGTPAWMAPEQLRDLPAGPPADVFAWGALVAFAATGRHPFGGGPPEAVAYRVLHDPPDLDGVPGSVRRLVQDALARDPAARPTATRIAGALAAAPVPTEPMAGQDATRALPVAAGPWAVAAGPTRRRRRRRVGPLVVTAALLAGLVTAPHVVLAATGGADGSSGQYAGGRCDGDHEEADEGRDAALDEDPDDRDDDGDDHDEDALEERDRDDQEAAATPVAPGAGSVVTGQPHPAPPSGPAVPGPAPARPRPGPAGDVLGS
jgi:eukaryotic-like serine/threonine-protein kinase